MAAASTAVVGHHRNSNFSSNSAYRGGGIYSGGTVAVSNSIFFGSNAGWGGGIYSGGPVDMSNEHVLRQHRYLRWRRHLQRRQRHGDRKRRPTFSGGSANWGGGIYNANDGKVTVSNERLS